MVLSDVELASGYVLRRDRRRRVVPDDGRGGEGEGPVRKAAEIWWKAVVWEVTCDDLSSSERKCAMRRVPEANGLGTVRTADPAAFVTRAKHAPVRVDRRAKTACSVFGR